MLACGQSQIPVVSVTATTGVPATVTRATDSTLLVPVMPLDVTVLTVELGRTAE